MKGTAKLSYKAEEKIHARSGHYGDISSPFQQCWSGRALLLFPLLAKQKRVSDLMLGHCKFAAKQLGSMPGNLKKLLHSHPRRYLRRPNRVAADFLKAFGLSIVE